jgi:ribosomal protein S12 methylthiotransferase
MKTVYLKNLGCPKNEVDGNILLKLLEKENLRSTDDPSKADIVIVNSCGFIDAAKEESIDEVLSLAQLKAKYKFKLVLAGCLAQRYKQLIEKEMPEVDLVVGISNLGLVRDKILGLHTGGDGDRRFLKRYREYPVTQKAPDLPYAYLKISDGCDNFCSYCAIPLIRGRYRSRRMSHIIDEAKYLAGQGVVELILVAQDITLYGSDLYGQRRLVELLKKLERVEGIRWIRMLYTHPAHFYNPLIDYLGASEKVIPYIDLPLQHISDRILKMMNRKINSERIKKLVDRLRKKIGDLVLRTTYILGFPGESEADFERLWNFQNEFGIERVGVFPYSREEDTKAEKYAGDVPDRIVTERIDRLMTLVMDQSLARNTRFLGKKMEVLIDERHKDGYYTARHYDQAPEIDGLVRAQGRFRPGRFYDVRVVNVEAYDLEAREWKE